MEEKLTFSMQLERKLTRMQHHADNESCTEFVLHWLLLFSPDYKKLKYINSKND